jgi:hypothetical protein
MAAVELLDDDELAADELDEDELATEVFELPVTV